MYSHKQTFLQLEELGKQLPIYQKTFEFPGYFIDDSHKFYSDCPVEDSYGLIQIKNRRRFGSIIQGWLQRTDALKLYEMAYFATGDILELGSYHGLSTSILAHANLNSPHPKTIYSIDLDITCVNHTKATLRSKHLTHNVHVLCDDAVSAISNFASQEKRFGFVFIDHSHAYKPVYQVCRKLSTVIIKDGFCLFHDFNDPRNTDNSNSDFGVYQAVSDGLDHKKFEFYGVYGCAALYCCIKP